MDVAKTDQLGTRERIHEKIEKIKQLAREAPAVSGDDGAEVQSLRDALRVLQTRERELHQQLEEANMRMERRRERIEVILLKSKLIISPSVQIIAFITLSSVWYVRVVSPRICRR